MTSYIHTTNTFVFFLEGDRDFRAIARLVRTRTRLPPTVPPKIAVWETAEGGPAMLRTAEESTAKKSKTASSIKVHAVLLYRLKKSVPTSTLKISKGDNATARPTQSTQKVQIEAAVCVLC